jgi:TRAP-type transport system periplasmic protein
MGTKHTGSRPRRALAFALVAGAVMLTGCSAAESTGPEQGSLADMEPIVLTVSHPQGPDSPTDAAIRAYLDYVVEATDGKIDYKIYPASTLHPGAEGLSALESGLTDITFYLPGYFPEELPVAVWASSALAGQAGGNTFPQAALASTAASFQLYEKSTEIRSELAAAGAMPLAVWGSHPLEMLCARPTSSLAEAKGATIVTPGEPWVSQARATGMEPTFIDPAERYESLQRGIVDCIQVGPAVFMEEGLWEVAKYNTPAAWAAALGVGYIISAELWDTLPLEARQILFDGKAIIPATFAEQTLLKYATWAEKAPGMGIEVLDPDDLNDVITEFNDEQFLNASDTAPASSKDPDAVLDIFVDSMKEWEGVLDDHMAIPRVPTTADNVFQRYLTARDVPWEKYRTALSDSIADARP